MLLKLWREAQKLTIAEAAAQADLASSTWRDVECGVQMPRDPATIIKIQHMTRHQVTIQDHFDAWKSANRARATAAREEGQQAAKSKRGRNHGTKSKRRRQKKARAQRR